MVYLFFLKQKTADEMRISDWSLYVCSSDLGEDGDRLRAVHRRLRAARHGRGRHGRGRPGALGMDGAGDRVDDAWRTAPRPAELVDVLAAGAAGTRGVADGIEIGRASCRERVCQYVLLSVVAVSLKIKSIDVIITDVSSKPPTYI